jgi:hypothetical protein
MRKTVAIVGLDVMGKGLPAPISSMAASAGCEKHSMCWPTSCRQSDRRRYRRLGQGGGA